MSSSNSPCAACKFLRRKCTQECDFAPYFPPDNPQRFACVHRVFGASNVAKLLKELSASQRDDAVKSLAYEAEARLRDPVYGCVGFISVLQQRLRQIQTELHSAKKELANHLNPQAMQYLMSNPGAVLMPNHPNNNLPNNNNNNPFALFPNYPPNNLPPQTVMPGGGGALVIRDAQQQELLEAQQLAVAQQQQQQVMFRNFEQQQQELLRFNSGGGFDPAGGGFGVPPHADVAPALALGTFDNVGGGYQIQQGEHHVNNPHHPPIEAQLLLSPQQSSEQQPPHQQQQSETEDGRSVGPSCWFPQFRIALSFVVRRNFKLIKVCCFVRSPSSSVGFGIVMLFIYLYMLLWWHDVCKKNIHLNKTRVSFLLCFVCELCVALLLFLILACSRAFT